MAKKYFYPDTREMVGLYSTLEELLSQEDFSMTLDEGSKFCSDPSPDFLLRVLFTPVEDRCFYLSRRNYETYKNILIGSRDGTYQGLSEEKFEKKRKKWIENIRKTDHPMLRVVKALKYAREVDAWETKKHISGLIFRMKGVLMTMEVLGNMIDKEYSLSQIAEIATWMTKAEIYGHSLIIKKPLELTPQEYEEVEKEYRKTGEPDVLKDIFGEPDLNQEGESEDE